MKFVERAADDGGDDEEFDGPSEAEEDESEDDMEEGTDDDSESRRTWIRWWSDPLCGRRADDGLAAGQCAGGGFDQQVRRSVKQLNKKYAPTVRFASRRSPAATR